MAQPNIRETCNEISLQITAIRKKTSILTDYYISPNPVPTAISAYDPRLAVLESRVKSLQQVSFPYLTRLLDHATAHGAVAANSVIDELLNAVHGLKLIFEQHYDRTLEQRAPYQTIYQLLELREGQLRTFADHDLRNPAFLRPESIRATESLSFCKGAIAMLNLRDTGRVRPVQDRDLSDANRLVVSRFAGGFLWWECVHCAYRVKYHMVNSLAANINQVDELRDFVGAEIAFHTSFLAKSHLFISAVTDRDQKKTRRASSFSSFLGSASTTSIRDAWNPVYGCIFCFAEGRDLSRVGRTTFEKDKDLAKHLVEKHAKTLPPALILQKFKVAVKGKAADGVRRWDVNFK